MRMFKVPLGNILTEPFKNLFKEIFVGTFVGQVASRREKWTALAASSFLNLGDLSGFTSLLHVVSDSHGLQVCDALLMGGFRRSG